MAACLKICTCKYIPVSTWTYTYVHLPTHNYMYPCLQMSGHTHAEHFPVSLLLREKATVLPCSSAQSHTLSHTWVQVSFPCVSIWPTWGETSMAVWTTAHSKWTRTRHTTIRSVTYWIQNNSRSYPGILYRYVSCGPQWKGCCTFIHICVCVFVCVKDKQRSQIKVYLKCWQHQATLSHHSMPPASRFLVTPRPDTSLSLIH